MNEKEATDMFGLRLVAVVTDNISRYSYEHPYKLNTHGSVISRKQYSYDWIVFNTVTLAWNSSNFFDGGNSNEPNRTISWHQIKWCLN